MKIEWFETIAAVVQYGTFSKAAEIIPCSQSSVSRQVKSAEDELGFEIFERTAQTSKVELTADGQRILPYIRRVLAEYSELEACSRQIKKKGKKRVVIGVERRSFGSKKTSELAAQLLADNAGIIVDIQNILTDAPKVSALTDKKLNAYIVALAKADDDLRDDEEFARETLGIGVGLNVDFIGSSDIYACVSKKDMLAHSSEACLSQLQNKSFYVPATAMDRYSKNKLVPKGLMEVFFRICKERNINFRLKEIDHGFMDVREVLTADTPGSVFISAFPKCLRGGKGLACVTITDIGFTVKYYLISLNNRRNAAIEEVAQLLKRRFAKNS